MPRSLVGRASRVLPYAEPVWDTCVIPGPCRVRLRPAEPHWFAAHWPSQSRPGRWGALNPADLEQQPQLCFNSSYAFFHRLENCGITCDSCQEISAVLGSSSSLIELSVGDNKIGDTGVAVLCQGLMHPNCKIQKLW